MNINLRITNITCDACVKLSNAALRGLPGVTKVTIGEDGTSLLESDKEILWKDIEAALSEVDKKAVLI